MGMLATEDTESTESLGGSSQSRARLLAKQIGIDGEEDGLGAGEGCAGFIRDFGFAAVNPSRFLDVTAGEQERRGERDGLEVVHFHLAGHGEDAELAVGFAHGFVEQGGDDASVSVSGRTFEAVWHAHSADDGLLLVDEKFKAEASAVGLSAAKAVIEGAVRERF